MATHTNNLLKQTAASHSLSNIPPFYPRLIIPTSLAVWCCVYLPASWLCVWMAAWMNNCRYCVVLLWGILNLSLLFMWLVKLFIAVFHMHMKENEVTCSLEAACNISPLQPVPSAGFPCRFQTPAHCESLSPALQKAVSIFPLCSETRQYFHVCLFVCFFTSSYADHIYINAKSRWQQHKDMSHLYNQQSLPLCTVLHCDPYRQRVSLWTPKDSLIMTSPFTLTPPQNA